MRNMASEDRERLARIEAMLEHQGEVLDSFVRSQSRNNELFFEVRDQVREMDAKQRASIATMSVVGAITVAISGLVAWVVTIIRG